MTKALEAIEFDGTTFGMSVDAGAETYKKFKAQVYTMLEQENPSLEMFV